MMLCRSTFLVLAFLITVSTASAEDLCGVVGRIVLAANEEVPFRSVRELRFPGADECEVRNDPSNPPHTYRCYWRYADLDRQIDEIERELPGKPHKGKETDVHDDVVSMMRSLSKLREQRKSFVHGDLDRLSAAIGRCLHSWPWIDQRHVVHDERGKRWHYSWMRWNKTTGETVELHIAESDLKLEIPGCRPACPQRISDRIIRELDEASRQSE